MGKTGSEDAEAEASTSLPSIINPRGTADLPNPSEGTAPMIFKLASVLAVGFVSLASIAPAHAYQCKHLPTTASAGAVLKASAQGKAVTAWSSKVKANLGLSWSVWDIASAKSVTCSKVGNTWTCQAKAKPCNYVVQ
jgi:hypothetical protein